MPALATWHESLQAFKRELIAHALAGARGNRTHAARALGLQRTYLLRLMKELGVGRTPGERSGDAAPPPSSGSSRCPVFPAAGSVPC